jgi:hypothetical protein
MKNEEMLSKLDKVRQQYELIILKYFRRKSMRIRRLIWIAELTVVAMWGLLDTLLSDTFIILIKN